MALKGSGQGRGGPLIARAELRAAFAVMAAASATAFSSGRGIALFFTQTGKAAWPGIFLASGLFALLVRGMLAMSRKTGAAGLAGSVGRMMGPGRGRAVGALSALLAGLVAAVTINSCASLGALALPVKNARLTGAMFALLIAVAMAADRRLMPFAGAVAVGLAAVFYGAMMIDPRPVTVHMRARTVLTLSGNLWAAGVLAALHACLNGAVAAVCGVCAPADIRPGRAALAAGTMMLVCLICANGAMLRGGDVLCAQAMPTVLLAARWGVAGFWLCAGFMYLCATATLAASLSALAALAGTVSGRSRPAFSRRFSDHRAR